MSQLQVRDVDGKGIPRINIRISEGAKPSDAAIYDIDTDLAGNQGWPIPYWANAMYTLWVNYANVNPAYGHTSVTVPPSSGDVPIVLPRAIPILQRIHADGWDIKQDDGSRYVHNQATNYLLFQRFMEGQDVAPLLYEGFAGYNVTFLMKTVSEQAGLRALTPDNYPQLYQQADAFFAYMRDQGKRVEATLICDNNLLGYALEKLVTHTEALYEIIRPYSHVSAQLVNEGEANGVNVQQFTKPNGVFCSRGSSLAGGACPLPPWDYSTAHLSRQGGGAYLDAQPFYMINGYGGYAGTQGPVVTNETRGASNTENSDRRSNDPNYFRRIAGAMREWAGGDFHFDYGIHSDPCVADSVQDHCRLAFLEGLGAR